MAHCSEYPAITRSWVGIEDWYLGHRTDYNADGTGIHTGRHDEHFNSTFHDTCNNWITNLDFWTRNYGSAGGVVWVGDVGVGFCKSGYHGSARAFDLTKIQFSNGMVDMNWSWRDERSMGDKRRYLACAAQCRRYVITVLTAWYNTAHENHIHFDNGGDLKPIRTSVRSDTTLVQASCNWLNGESLVIDGDWGSLTEAAYQRLLDAFNMKCLNPKTSLSHALTFLSYIVRHGFADASAGAYKYTC